MRKNFLLIILFLPMVLWAQKEDYVWRVGYYCGINFNGGQADTFTVNSLLPLTYTNASTCDSSESYFFYKRCKYLQS